MKMVIMLKNCPEPLEQKTSQWFGYFAPNPMEQNRPKGSGNFGPNPWKTQNKSQGFGDNKNQNQHVIIVAVKNDDEMMTTLMNLSIMVQCNDDTNNVRNV